MAGQVIFSIAAAFSTSSAIIANMFSTSRLMETVTKKRNLQHIFVKRNDANSPMYASLCIAGLAAFL